MKPTSLSLAEHGIRRAALNYADAQHLAERTAPSQVADRLAEEAFADLLDAARTFVRVWEGKR